MLIFEKCYLRDLGGVDTQNKNNNHLNYLKAGSYEQLQLRETFFPMQLPLPVSVTAQYSYFIWFLLSIRRGWTALLSKFLKPFGFGLFLAWVVFGGFLFVCLIGLFYS